MIVQNYRNMMTIDNLNTFAIDWSHRPEPFAIILPNCQNGYSGVNREAGDGGFQPRIKYGAPWYRV